MRNAVRLRGQFIDGSHAALAAVIWTPPPDVPPRFAVLHVPAAFEEMNKSRRMLATAVAGPVVIELGQLFLPQKTPDLTDTVLGIAGALVGYALVRRFRPTTVTPAATVAAPVAQDNGRAPRSAAALTLAGFVTLCVLMWIATHASSVPYNVSKLTQTAFPIGSIVAIVAALYLTFGMPVWLLALTREPRLRSLLLPPVLLVGYGIGLWCLLRISVPLPMVEKIIGTPILGWPSELEDIGRLLALASVVGIATVMAAIVVASLFLRIDPNRYARVAWIGWSLVALPLAFHALVPNAKVIVLTGQNDRANALKAISMH